MSDFQTRFGGIQRLYGETLANIFQHTHVTIVGIGGVGSWAAEALARTGFGYINLVDHDDISSSNINRQIHSTIETVDRSKVEVMKERIESINPDCKVTIIDDRISSTNCDKFFDKEVGSLKTTQFVIDAIDNVKPKTALLAYCFRHKIPIITTGAAGGLIDPTQITYADLSKTTNDALAAKVRYNLRSHYNFSRNVKKRFNIECIYSTEQVSYPQEDGTVSHQKPNLKGETLDCDTGYGSSSCVTSTFGFVAVSRLIEKIRQQHIKNN